MGSPSPSRACMRRIKLELRWAITCGTVPKAMGRPTLRDGLRVSKHRSLTSSCDDCMPICMVWMHTMLSMLMALSLFLLAARETVPAYDERFRGYGMNKIAHTFEMAYQGFNFFVVDHHDAFLIAKWHPRSASSPAMCSKDAERQQLRRVAAHFRIFKEELRYRGAGGSRATSGVIVSVPQVSCAAMPKRAKERKSSESCMADTCMSDGSTSGGGPSRAHSDSSGSIGQ
mmetsp:Transcript_57631/g.106537  ORF Transcript_57631/g.106537 Transcript_57631/m.106537 type:complete len:229 (-) Transcript_57631:64-750(-)